MLDMKKLAALSKEQQLDMLRCKIEIARKAYEKSEGLDDKVREELLNYKKNCEKALQSFMWSQCIDIIENMQ